MVDNWRLPEEQKKKKKMPYKKDLATFEPFPTPFVQYNWASYASRDGECVVLHIVEGKGRPYGHSEKRSVCRCNRLIMDTDFFQPAIKYEDPIFALRAVENDGVFKLCSKCGSTLDFARVIKEHMAYRKLRIQENEERKVAEEKKRLKQLAEMEDVFDDFLDVIEEHFPEIRSNNLNAWYDVPNTDYKVFMKVVKNIDA